MQLLYFPIPDPEKWTDASLPVAPLRRKLTPASEWTYLDVEPYKIKVVRDDMESFFGISQLPSAASTCVPKEILQCEGFESGKFQEKDARLFYTLALKANVIRNRDLESPVGDFAAHILSCLGFDEPDGVIHRGYGIEFTSCGWRDKPTQLDACVERPDGICLIVVEERHRPDFDPFDCYAQIIAKAVAAFQHKRGDMRKSTKESQMIYGIIMRETQPTFLKMEITKDLETAICSGTSPQQTTTIHELIPPILFQYPSRGRFGYMSNLANREYALGCFEALRQDIEKTWGV